jgi:hypothetical protein
LLKKLFNDKLYTVECFEKLKTKQMRKYTVIIFIFFLSLPSFSLGAEDGGMWPIISYTTPSEAVSVIINNGELASVGEEVVLDLAAEEAVFMMISGVSDFGGAEWENFSPRKTWRLTPEPGMKYVYAKFKKADETISATAFDMIELLDPSAVGDSDDEIIVAGAEIDWRSAQVEAILSEAAYLSAGGITAGKEVYEKYVKPILSGMEEAKAAQIEALAFFIQSGTQSTRKLGAGERAGVINSYKAAFGKLPGTESEWADAIKIANGRWPNERSMAAEAKAKKEFKKVYLREADMNDPNDNAAITIMSYGLRPEDRDPFSETNSINTFKSIYKKTPQNANDWDVIRAIAYSGARR